MTQIIVPSETEGVTVNSIVVVKIIF